MGIRGPKSSASLTVVTSGAIEPTHRPEPLPNMGIDERAEWAAIVNRMPADWFPRESHALLESFCRHVITARRVAQMIAQTERAKSIDLDDYDQLLKMYERETRAASSLATRLRITQQTTYDKSKKKPFTPKKPWEEN